jgi:hypothetical protein
VRTAPIESPIGDHTTSRMNTARRLVFVTAFHPDKRLLLGYVFRREEYPWTQLWEFYPGGDRNALAAIATRGDWSLRPSHLICRGAR